MTEDDLATLVDRLSVEDQVALLSGEDFWSVPALPQHGIGKLRVTDGPNGARGSGSLVGGVKSACFPVGIALGSSWNPALIEAIGRALAAEVRDKGAHVLLAPTVNMQRSVTNGRNFECYSEDPELTAALCVAYVRGLQSEGVAATVKHFVGNESEIERTTISSEVDEVALREIYLRPFEDAVKKADVWAIMSSYNRLNGTYTAENAWLLTQVLRGEWGYDGVVMSDWFGSRSTAPTVNAGLDLEMPGPTRDRGEKLVAAVAAGKVTRQTLRDRALNMLRLMDRCGALRDTEARPERAEDRPATRALIRRAGAEGMVLLQNDGLLPLAPPKGRIAVIGPNAKVAQIMGGGSAQLNPHYAVSPWQGLVDRLGAAALTYAPGCTNHRWEPLFTGPLEVDFFADRSLSGPVAHHETLDKGTAFWVPPFAGGQVDPNAFSARMRGAFTPAESGPHRIGIFATGPVRVLLDGKVVIDLWSGWTKGRTFFEEGCDEVVALAELQAGRSYSLQIDYAARTGDNMQFSAFRLGIGKPLGDAEIAEAARIAAEAETALIFVGRSGEWDTEGSDLTDIRLPGRQDDLVAAVLQANPRSVVVLQTGGPVEMPWLGQAAAVLQAWYPGQEAGNAITDVLFGDAEPGGRLPQTFPQRWADNPTQSQDPEIYPGLNGKVRYEEGLHIGYRHYDRMGLVPMFPFGHGLGYTAFQLFGVAIERQGEGATLRARLRNTGLRAGATVVQVYVGEDDAPAHRPKRMLKAFAKVFADPGHEVSVTLDLPPRAFMHCDVAAGLWRRAPGRFTLSVGFSAADIRASLPLQFDTGATEPF